MSVDALRRRRRRLKIEEKRLKVRKFWSKKTMNVIFEMTHLQHAQQFLLRRFFPAQLQQFPAELLGLGRLFRARHYFLRPPPKTILCSRSLVSIDIMCSSGVRV